MSGYVFPCPNKCLCERMRIEGNGYPWFDEWDQWQIVHNRLSHSPNIWYRVCAGCRLPADQTAATILNDFLGNKLEEIEIESDFLDLLNGIE